MIDDKGTYLDHNATTLIRPEARDTMLETLSFPGNPSAIHKIGRRAKRLLEESREAVTNFVNAAPKAVILFTSGATEANNLVLKGAGCTRLLVSTIEHPSVRNVFSEREFIPVLPNGVVDLDALDKMLAAGKGCALVSVMMVNNETGVIQPIEEIVKIGRKHSALIHTDAVQAAGRIDIDIQKLGVDFLTLSGHKVGGPQGVGCLVLANCVTVDALISGGGQEKNLRSGTENLAGIAGFAKALELADPSAYQRLGALRDKLEASLKEIEPEIVIYGADAPRVLNTTMFALPGVLSETQLIALDLADVYVSNGSACSSGTVKPSSVLTAMGVDADEANCALRVSLGWSTTEEDINTFLREWTKMYERIKTREKKTCQK